MNSETFLEYTGALKEKTREIFKLCENKFNQDPDNVDPELIGKIDLLDNILQGFIESHNPIKREKPERLPGFIQLLTDIHTCSNSFAELNLIVSRFPQGIPTLALNSDDEDVVYLKEVIEGFVQQGWIVIESRPNGESRYIYNKL